jgi:hypothetical protein
MIHGNIRSTGAEDVLATLVCCGHSNVVGALNLYNELKGGTWEPRGERNEQRQGVRVAPLHGLDHQVVKVFWVTTYK